MTREMLCVSCSHKEVCYDYATYPFDTCKHYLEEPKQGEWIEHHSGGVITFICSECKNIIAVDFEDFEKGEFKYCDMCGARMTYPKPR